MESQTTQTRRQFMCTTAGTAGAITLLSFPALAAAHGSHTFETATNETITVHPVAHASIVLTTPVGTIYVDPVGDRALYRDFASADLVLITHEHGDHFDAETLEAIVETGTKIISNPAVFAKLSDEMKAKATELANGGSDTFKTLLVEAIPAYNTTENRLKFHPEGRDNGYVLTFEGFRIYVSGDTEDIPEMRGLRDIDLAFVCMNLPFTMDANAAASAVSEFAPKYVYPYHYRGRDGGTQDPQAFAKMIGGDTKVSFGDWY